MAPEPKQPIVFWLDRNIPEKYRATVIAGVTTVTATGQNFTPYKSVMVYYYLGSTLKKTWTLTVSCAGTFSVSFQPAPLDVGTAKVAANDSAGRNASKTFTIVA